MTASIPTLRTQARGKINLCLLLGPLRDDGYHEVATVIVPVDIADVVTLRPSPTGLDEVFCPGVEGDNLAAKAVRLFREETAWDGPPVRLEIEKRVPVAAGMGGGSGDAAAALRLVAAAAGVDDPLVIARIAPRLGADVPAMLDGRTVLASGVGEVLEPLPAPQSFGILILPARGGLSTPAVFRRAGELGLRRDSAAIEDAAGRIRSAATAVGWTVPASLIGLNDLGVAAGDLSTEVADSLRSAHDAGADRGFVTGSGPTVVGLFEGEDGPQRSRAAAGDLGDRVPPAIACESSPGSATIEETA